MDIASYTFQHFEDLSRHQHFYNIWIVGASPLAVLMEGSFIGRGISLNIYVFARQHNPYPLITLPYMWKFLWYVIFVVFVDDPFTMKI